MTTHLMHPSEQIALVMDLIYKNGMTTTSGGNMSLRDTNGDIWITPAGVDKGSLKAEDIVCVKVDGSVCGLHRASSEFPFHKAIYECRPDLNAVIHAHPPGLVSFSIVRKAPDTDIIPQARKLCGEVGYARYKLPGSGELGESIAQQFKEQYNSLIMENHGTVIGGSELFKTFQRFETLEFCAHTIINASRLGPIKTLSENQIMRFENQTNDLPEMTHTEFTSKEKAIRRDICKFIKRACAHNLMISSYGTVSVRWKENDFLITATGINRRFIEPDDIVQIKDGKREKGKLPSRSVLLHQKIYARHPHVNCVIQKQCPYVMAYCISGEKFDSRTIPESYILLKDIPVVPNESIFPGNDAIEKTLSKETPIVMVENESILVSGRSVLDSFDRLEVAEFSARSLIQGYAIGTLVPIGDTEIEDLKKKFL